MKKIFLIGEREINHNGDLKIVKKLIEKSKLAGFDAVKFQKRNPNVYTPENKKNQLKETPCGTMIYLEYKKRIEFGEKEFNISGKF